MQKERIFGIRAAAVRNIDGKKEAGNVQTKQLKENMKEKVRDLEDGGMRLIKRGKISTR